MISVLEIGFDTFHKSDSDRRKLQEERRMKCAQHLKSYDLILYSKNGTKTSRFEREAKNLTVYYVVGSKFLYPFKILILAHAIAKKKNIDVVTSIDPFMSGFIACLLRLYFKIPVNVQLHSDYFSEFFWGPPNVSDFLRRVLLKIVLKKSNTIRVVSELQKEKVEGMGIKNRLIEVIPTPVDITNLNSLKIDISLCAKYKVNSDTKLLLFVGRLCGAKDLPVLLQSFKIIKARYENIKLLVIGMGELNDQLNQFSNDLGLNGNVLFLGSVSNKVIFSYYYGCDIFVISSKHEGRSTVLTEAALSRKPIVATRFSGTYDLIVDGKTGFVVDIGDYRAFADRVLWFLNNPIKINEFGKEGYEYVSEKIGKVNDIRALVNLWERTAEGVKQLI
ncbi:glycosyltransferase family 4 protein [Candidatus Omnitrophota bacterium]